MKLVKRVLALTLAAVMCVPTGFAAKEVSAQEKYETKGVAIFTDLVPNTDDIKVTEAGKAIETKTNVEFDLDCNVDCDWRVREQNNGVCDIVVDSMGHVMIPSTVAKGTYYVDAVANTDRLINAQDTTVSCKINVGSQPAKSTKVVLDKEIIEAEAQSRGIVTVNDKGIVVDGSVSDVELVSHVFPEYLLEDDVTFSFNSNVKGAEINSRVFLSTNKADDAIIGETLYATVGKEENNNHQFEFKVNKRDKYDFNVVPNVKLTQSANGHYDMQMNQNVLFSVDEYSDILLPTRGTCTGITWDIKYGNGDSVELINSEANVDLCKITVSNNGYDINIVTPNSKSANADKYKEAVKAANGKDALVLTPTMNFTNNSAPLSFPSINISFSDKEASFKNAVMNLSNISYLENIDYVIKKEKLGDEIVDVYYMESDNRKINLVNITDSDVDGIADFDDSRSKGFSGDDARYTIAYSLTDIDPKTFGESTPNYINKELDDQINESNMVKNPTRFVKKGIGYKKLTIECSGAVKSTKTYYLRFVTDAGSISIRHTKYSLHENEYRGSAVVHIRKGERDNITVVRYNSNVDEAINQLSVTDPYIEYTFTPIKGENVASATTAKEHVQINGLNTGKVLVTATSVVDKTEIAEFILYVNDEIMQPETISIDTTEAQSLGMMTSQGEVKGKISDIPLGILAHGSESLGVPAVKWEVNDDKYATITQDGKLTTIKSTGGNTIKVIATSLVNPELKAEYEIKITDVAATEIDTIGELVTDGMPAMVEEGTQKNTGSCKANTTFKLVPKVYLPLNQTSADGEITWTSSNPEVATIDNAGNVVALTEGETRLTITYTPKASSAKSTVYTLTVSGIAVNVTSIVCADTLVLSRVGATETIIYNVMPETATNKAVQFISSNESIVSVTDTGVVTAKAPGTATITIASIINPNVKKVITVTVQGNADSKPGQNTPVTQKPSQTTNNNNANTNNSTVNPTTTTKKTVTIKLAKKTIKKGKKTTVKFTNKAKSAKVTYTLDKKSKKIVSVSKKGVVKGKKKGTAKINVKVKQNGKTYKKTLVIKVK